RRPSRSCRIQTGGGERPQPRSARCSRRGRYDMTTQKTYSVRIPGELAEALAQRARLGGESEAAYIRSLVMADLGRGGEEEGARSDVDSIIEHVNTLTFHVNDLSRRVDSLIAEFVHFSKWLMAQTSGFPDAGSEEGARPAAEPVPGGVARARGLSR